MRLFLTAASILAVMPAPAFAQGVETQQKTVAVKTTFLSPVEEAIHPQTDAASLTALLKQQNEFLKQQIELQTKQAQQSAEQAAQLKQQIECLKQELTIQREQQTKDLKGIRRQMFFNNLSHF